VPSHPEYAHLPAGREPGWQTQTKSREARRQAGIVAMVVVGVMLIGAGVYFTVEPPNPSKDQPAILALAFFGGIGLGVIAWAGFLWWRRRPKPSAFSVEAEDSELRRGESSRATVRLLDPARVEGGVRIGVVCREFVTVEVNQATNDLWLQELRDAEVTGSWQPLDPEAGEWTVEFTVPEGSPYSYEGHYVSVAWGVVVEEERVLGAKQTIDPFWVLP
jgi:hypothetical protein